MLRTVALVIALLALVAVGCADTSSTGQSVAPPEATSLLEVEALIADGAPTVLNVWASWCIPCRSEAPLLDTASRTSSEEVKFIALNVRDTPDDAARFIASYMAEAPMRQLADRDGRIPVELGGGRGVPITFFYRSDGTLAHVHRGVIDEPALATYLDEITR